MLDTQLALWSVLGDPRAGDRVRAAFADPNVEIVVSAVSIWEIAIKHALPRRRDPMPIGGGRARELFEQSNYTVLPVTAAHAVAVDALPPLHGDPFERMLVAQAITEPMRLLTRDARLREYGALVEPA